MPTRSLEPRHASTYVECPLCRLPRTTAESLIQRLYAPDQRFARAFYRYWFEVVGQPPDTARRSTDAELAESVRDIMTDLTDSAVHTIGFDTSTGYHPVGMFSFRPLMNHCQGRVLLRHLWSTSMERRYVGELAMAHAVALLDQHAKRNALENILLSIAQKALVGGYSFVFFFSSDCRLANLYRRYGMEFPPDLRFPTTGHLVGVYEPRKRENLDRMKRTARRLGVDLISQGVE